MTEPNDSLGRGLSDLTIQLSRAYSRRARQYDEMGLQEITQQYQLDVTGTETGWGYIDLAFDSPFSYAPTRRNNDLVYPHSSFGVFCPIEDPDTGLALEPIDFRPTKVYACVTHYERDPDSDQFTGARVFVEVSGLSSDPDNLVAASLHATFQGYAAMTQDESDLG